MNKVKKVLFVVFLGAFGVAAGASLVVFVWPLLTGVKPAPDAVSPLLSVLLFAGTSIFYWFSLDYIFDLSAKKSTTTVPSLKGISNFADFFGLGLRKRVKAVAGDFEVEIKRLHKEKRYKTAQWNKALAWGYAIWYVLRGPVDWFAETLIKSWKGL